MGLATKHRPRLLKDLVGQEKVVLQLEGFLKNPAKFPKSILISGNFSSGKTTIARMIALYLNCLSLKEGHPCMKCRNCSMIKNLTFPDLLEIDAASDRKIDDIRELQNVCRLNPLAGKYRVIILDECHQITGPGQAALLKTLEDSTKYTVIILCTTAPEKLLRTIVSRCVKFNLGTISPKDTAVVLVRIAKKENFDLKEKDAMTIANIVNGYPRDAITLLEQFIACSANEKDVKASDLVKRISLDRMTYIPPQILVMKFLSNMTVDYSLSLEVLESVDYAEAFMASLCQVIAAMVAAKIDPSVANPEVRRIVEKFKAKQVITMLDLAMQHQYQIKQYINEPKQVMLLMFAKMISTLKTSKEE